MDIIIFLISIVLLYAGEGMQPGLLPYQIQESLITGYAEFLIKWSVRMIDAYAYIQSSTCLIFNCFTVIYIYHGSENC